MATKARILCRRVIAIEFKKSALGWNGTDPTIRNGRVGPGINSVVSKLAAGGVLWRHELRWLSGGKKPARPTRRGRVRPCAAVSAAGPAAALRPAGATGGWRPRERSELDLPDEFARIRAGSGRNRRLSATHADERHRTRGRGIPDQPGVWLADTIADMERDQDCMMQGRANCVPIELPIPPQQWAIATLLPVLPTPADRRSPVCRFVPAPRSPACRLPQQALPPPVWAGEARGIRLYPSLVFRAAGNGFAALGASMRCEPTMASTSAITRACSRGDLSILR